MRRPPVPARVTLCHVALLKAWIAYDTQERREVRLPESEVGAAVDAACAAFGVGPHDVEVRA